MSIQWFPGHMNKARNEIKEIMPQMDVIIEVMDARIPYSSDNPMVAQLRRDKPVIKILNKADLADPAMTEQWMASLEAEQGVKSLSLREDKSADVGKIITLCQKLVPGKIGPGKQIKAMIMGIPNVGKSTLINTLAKRVVAKTGNEPAVTRSQQKIRLDEGVMLYDTPGMLWPKLDSEQLGYRLAATGAVRDTVVQYEDVASFVVEYMLRTYPEALKQRYGIDPLPETDWEFIELAGKKRGCVKSGGHVDFVKFGTILINELRAGTLGGITLETPEMKAVEQAEIAVRKEKAELIKETTRRGRKR